MINAWLARNRILLQAVMLTAGATVLVMIAIVLQPYWRRSPTDFIVYWEAGERLREGGEQLYAAARDPMNRIGRYIYPPAFAALFAPLTMLPREIGFVVWALIELGLTALAFWAMRGLCGIKGKITTLDWLFPCMLAIFGPLVANHIEGQVNMLVVACIAIGLWLDRSGRGIRGGLWLGLAVHLKVLPLALLPVLIVQRRWRACAGQLIGIALFTLLPAFWTVPLLGPLKGLERTAQLNIEYARQLVLPQVGSAAAPELGGSRAPNNSLAAVSLRYFGADSELLSHIEQRGPLLFVVNATVLRWAGPLIGGLMYVLALALAWKRREEPLLRTACIGLAFVAVSLGHLLCWMHHLVFVVLVIGPLAARALANDESSECATRTLVISVGAMVMLVGMSQMDPSEWMQIIGLPTLGVLIVWAATYLSVLRIRPKESAPLEP